MGKRFKNIFKSGFADAGSKRKMKINRNENGEVEKRERAAKEVRLNSYIPFKRKK